MFNLQIFSPIHLVAFSSCWWIYLLCRSSLVWCSPSCLFLLLVWDLKLSTGLVSKSILPMFSSRSFMVLGFTFKSLVYFELIFVCGVRYGCFVLLHLIIVSPVWFIEETCRDCLFPIIYSWLLCCKVIDHIFVDLFLDSLFCSIDLCFCLYANTVLFWFLWLCNIIWNQEYDASSFVLLS